MVCFSVRKASERSVQKRLEETVHGVDLIQIVNTLDKQTLVCKIFHKTKVFFICECAYDIAGQIVVHT